MVISAQHFTDLVNGYEKTTSGLWTHRGRLQVLGGPVDLPAGSIDTSEIAPNACQQLLGSYAANPAWSTTVAATWVETPFSCTVTCGGGLCRIEYSASFYHSVTGAGWLIGWALDGTAVKTGSSQTCAAAGYVISTTGIDYYQPSAGNHRFSVCAFMITAGTLTFYASYQYGQIYVTEQKR